MKYAKILISGIFSGFLVGTGGIVYLSAENKVVGAVLFSVALLTICFFSLYLFTGRIGYLATDRRLSTVSALAVGIVGNAVGSVICATLDRVVKPENIEKANLICSAKLEQPIYATVTLAGFCGVLMYIAVETYKSNGTPIGILFCIPVFILSGFEHSIADIFYFTVSNVHIEKWILFIVAAVFGNAVGSLLSRAAHVFSKIESSK